MTSIFQGSPLPSITTTDTTTTQGPDWYNNYLSQLAQPGTSLLGKTGDQLVAGLTPLQQSAITGAPTALTGYQPMMGAAAATATEAARGITPEMIQSYLNPYTSNVVNEMERLTQQSMQRSMLPTLRGAFVSGGGLGSQRMAGALGQMGADVQASLTGQQAGVMRSAMDKAMDIAAQQAGLKRQAADTQRGIATSQLDSAIKELQERYGLGAKEQQYEQSKILAPIAAAKSAADVFANVKVPSTVSQTKVGPVPGAYSTSPLAQIAGLGALFASPAGGTSAYEGVLRALFGPGATSSGILRTLSSTNPNTQYENYEGAPYADMGSEEGSDAGVSSGESESGGWDTEG
jgi:hypothetical protein